MAFSCETFRTPSGRETRTHILISAGFPLPAGSSSSLSIMSGVSSEGIAPAGGQYGSVPPSTTVKLQGIVLTTPLSRFTPWHASAPSLPQCSACSHSISPPPSTVECVSYPQVSSWLKLTQNTSAKLWIIFELVSQPFSIKIDS
jgi:hypothetical protein